MPRVAVPFTEWRPDIALLDNEFSSVAENVFVDANSYTPVPSLLPMTTTALPAQCCGLRAARTSTGEWKIYAGTTTKLYVYNGGTGTWTDVSRTTGGVYHVGVGDLWQWEQSGDKLVTVNINDDPQVINVDSGTNFAALAGSPPRATNVQQIGDFLVLSGLISNRRAIRWSAINDITGWTIGTNLCDEQVFPDGGMVQGVVGGEIGYVVQDQAIRLMQFLPGDFTIVFSFSRITHERGSVSKYGFVCVADTLYFLSNDGFYAVAGNQVAAIGDNKVNNWFLENSDPGRRNVVQALVSEHLHRIIWVFYGANPTAIYDRLLIYDWALQRWTTAFGGAQVWASLATLNLDLDTTGVEPGDALLDSTASPLDSYSYIGGVSFVGAIDPNGFLSALNGPNLAATLETAERHLVPGSRTFVSDVYPLVDCSSGTPQVAAGKRERLQDPREWSNPVDIEIVGAAAIFSSARLHRFRVLIPAGTEWSHAQGVTAEVQQDGTVA